MTLWLEAHISPLLAPWIAEEFDCLCTAFRGLGLHQTPDREAFFAARLTGAVILSKDADFPELLRRLGQPPKVIWLRCGNRSNQEMRTILRATLPTALELLKTDDLVEIKGAS